MNELSASSQSLVSTRELVLPSTRTETQAHPVPLEDATSALERGHEGARTALHRQSGGAGVLVQSFPQSLPPDNELWEVGHVARFLKRSVSWVYKKSAVGVLPVHRLDGWGLRYVPAEMRAWAEGQKRRKAPR